MPLTLSWVKDLQFVAEDDKGHGIVIESKKDGTAAGFTPMQLVLLAAAGCMAMDVVSILSKMKQQLTGATVEIAGQRAENHPKIFTAIDIVCKLVGHGLELEKAERAVELSRTTYCSAINTLRPDCKVNISVELGEG